MADNAVQEFREVPDYTRADTYGEPDRPTLTVKEMSADMQPRERVLRYGISSVSNADLLAIILRTGVHGYPITDICRDLMEMNGNLFLNVERLSREQIMETKGLGELKAMQVEAVMEIVRRYSRERVGNRIRIVGPDTIFEIMRPEIGNLPHEEMWAIFMNHSNQVIGKMRVSEGSATATIFDVKKILRRALATHTEGIALCHNHPSGILRPSGADDMITRRLRDACKTLEINFLDHLIVTTDGYYSYRDSTSLI